MGLTESGPVVRDWDGDTWGDDVMYRVRGREIKSMINYGRPLACVAVAPLSTCSANPAKSVCSRTVNMVSMRCESDIYETVSVREHDI